MALDMITAEEALLSCAVVGTLALKVKVLDKRGVVIATLIGWPFYFFGGWQRFALIIVFFAVSVAFTRYKSDLKYKIEGALAKGRIRSWRNVLANGGVATIFALLYPLSHSMLTLVGFVGSLSPATADILATEIGLLYDHEPRLITNLRKRVPAGTLGGVSTLGVYATLLGSFFIWLPTFLLGSSQPFDDLQRRLLLAVIAGGFAGSILDSLLGASIQGLYKCPVCGMTTEKKYHCGRHQTSSGDMETWITTQRISLRLVEVP